MELANVDTAPVAKCLGTISLSVQPFTKTLARLGNPATFLALDNSAFHGNLNPLSGSIFETCILPILLYGCEKWPLDASTTRHYRASRMRLVQESSVHLPKHHSSIYCGEDQLALAMCGHPSPYPQAHYLTSSTDDSISSRIFKSVATVDVYNVSFVQQCWMLEADTNTNTPAMCLKQPHRCPKYCEICKNISSNQIMNHCCHLPPPIPQLNT